MPNDLLRQISETLTSAKTIEDLTRPLLMLLELVTGLESTYLTRIDQGSGTQKVLYARNSKVMQIPEGLSVPWEGTLCKRALDEGRLYTDDAGSCWGDSEAAKALGIRTYVTTPIHSEDGSLFGTLCAASTETKPIGPEGRQALALFGMLIEHQIQREHLLVRLTEANSTLERHSFTDMLTGLPNRRAVIGELERLFALARRSGQKVLLAFIDLDGFKGINDTYGHETGDTFLTEIGRRLSPGLRAGDMLGRLGGDEFVVTGLTPGQDDPSAETAAAQAMRDRLAPLIQGRFDLGRCSLDYAGASFGVVAVDPAAGSPDQALKAADAAMYADKTRRKTERR